MPKRIDDLERLINLNKTDMLKRFESVYENQHAFEFMMDQHFKQVAESLKWITQAMVQSDITIKEGENAGPPPNVQIPLNMRQILHEESSKFRMHKMARLPFYRCMDGVKLR